MPEGRATSKGGKVRAGGKLLRRGSWVVLVLVAVAAFQHEHVVWSAAGRLHTEADVPPRSAILVLGAQIRGREPSHMLVDRLRTAANLYHLGKAPVIVVSGDGRAQDYDEVGVMCSWLREAGVPATALSPDRAGLRTLDSVHRARDVFGLRDVIVVSNPFHVARGVFLGVQYGIDAVGVGAPHGHAYSRRVLWSNRAREVAARIYAWWDVFVFGTRARVDGPAPPPTPPVPAVQPVPEASEPAGAPRRR